jgi:hypothetical protein
MLQSPCPLCPLLPATGTAAGRVVKAPLGPDDIALLANLFDRIRQVPFEPRRCCLCTAVIAASQVVCVCGGGGGRGNLRCLALAGLQPRRTRRICRHSQ